jgi:hypothetical protein
MLGPEMRRRRASVDTKRRSPYLGGVTEMAEGEEAEGDLS